MYLCVCVRVAAISASAVRCRICFTRCHMRHRQGREAGRGGVAIPSLSFSLSFSPLHQRMGVYWRPHQPSLFSYDPSVAFPTRWTRGDSATVRSHTDGCGDGGTREGKRTVEPFSCRFESPLLCRVVRARCPPRLPWSTPSISSHWPDLSPEFWWHTPLPIVLQESATAQEIATGSPITRCSRERSREDVLRCVRSRIDQPPRSWACTLSPMRRKYRSVTLARTHLDSIHSRNFA